LDLRYSPEDETFRQRARAWLAGNLPKKRLDTLEERRAWHRKLYEAGFVGMGWPKEYGGHDARPMEQAIVAEEMARANAPGPINGLGIAICGPTLVAHGTEWQKQRYLKNILTADEIWCQLYSEPNAGSDLASLQTAAIRQDGHYVVNGQKVWTSGGAIADLGILLARTDPTLPKHQGISYFVCDMRAPGVEVRPLKQITGSTEFCEVFLTDVRIPLEDRIGDEGQGWRLAQTTLGFERGGNTLSRATRAQANLGRLIEVVGRLERDGRPLLDDPGVRRKLGRMVAEVEVLRYTGLRILSKLERGQRPGAESSVDKLYYSELDRRHQELAQEILGPYGQLSDLPSELSLRGENQEGLDGSWWYNFLWSRAGVIYAGSSQIQKNIIGERVLGLPREPRADRTTGARE